MTHVNPIHFFAAADFLDNLRNVRILILCIADIIFYIVINTTQLVTHLYCTEPHVL